MTEEAERLIDLASQALANNAELHLAAKADLRRRLEISNPESGVVRDAIGAFERADRRPVLRHWRVVFYAATLVLVLWVIAVNFRQAMGLARMYSSLSSFSWDYPDQSKWKTEVLSAKQRLLMFGDEDSPTSDGKWKPLWDSEPGNPVFLANYAAAYFREQKEFSPEIIEAAKNIDPDNGWYSAMTAGGLTDGAVSKQKQKSASRTEIITPQWQIDDPDRLRSSLDLLHQAVSKPYFSNYEKELITLQIALLPKRTDFLNQMVPLAYTGGIRSSIISMRKLADVLCAGAQEAATKGDVERYKRIVNDWEKLSTILIQNGFTLIDLLVAKVVMFAPAENFRDAAEELGLQDEQKRFAELHELKMSDKARRDTRGLKIPGEDIVRLRGSIMASLTIPMVGRQVKNPPELTENDVRPGRYVDHALLSRGLSLATLLVLGVAAGLAALQRFRHSLVCRSLAKRMTDQIRFSDWLLILGVGILVPFGYYTVFIHLTPLSSREWSLGYSGFMHVSVEFLALVVMMVVLPALIAGWRLSKRGEFIGLDARRPWIGWTAAIAAALAIPVAGLLVSHSIFSGWMLYVSSLLLIFPLIWILVGCGRNLLGNADHALRRGTLARMLIPAWVFGMLVMVVSIPVHYRMERHWIQKDRLFEIRADAPAMSKYEWDVTQVLRAELLEIHP